MEQNNNMNVTNSNIEANVNQPESKMKRFWKEGLDFLKYALIALVIVIPIRMYIAQPFIVSGQSMMPTFQDKNYLIIDEVSYLLREPHRGEVIVFHYPVVESKYLIKRIIGLPGEKVEIKNGKVVIFPNETSTEKNGIILDEYYIKEPFETTKTYTLKDGEYFVMGDNRNQSADSRTWGILPRKNIVGRAFIRLYPFSKIDYLPGAIKQ